MNNILKVITVFALISIGTGLNSKKATAQVNVSFQVFYDELSPYGTWVNNSDYGYVWVPNVTAGFTPYGTNGYWLLTNDGWTWVSNYAWGWAPFHYGRWYTDPNYGPMWVPDNEWGPGWVTWRRSEGYYGWAPIGPGVSVNFAYSNSYNVPYNQWVFVKGENFGRTNINNYYVNSSSNVTIIHNSTVINNIHKDNAHNVSYNSGPDRREVEKHAGKKFTPVAIKESSKPGQKLSNNQLEVYRPKVQKNNSGGTKPVPNKVVSMKDLKSSPQKNNEVAPQKKTETKKEQPSQQQHNSQPKKEHPQQQQQKAQPNKEQPSQQQQHNSQQKKEQPQQEHKSQPGKEQPSQQQQHNSQPNKEQPSQQQQHNSQPGKEQPSQQQQHNSQPNREQPSQQQQHNTQPGKEQPSQQQQQHNTQPKQQKQGEQQQQHNGQQKKEQQQNPDHSNGNQQKQ